jgi:hypothetical protein
MDKDQLCTDSILAFVEQYSEVRGIDTGAMVNNLLAAAVTYAACYLPPDRDKTNAVAMLTEAFKGKFEIALSGVTDETVCH